MDRSALPATFNASDLSSGSYLVSLAPGTDDRVAVEAVSDVFGNSLYVRSQAEARRAEAASPVTSSVFGYLRSQSQLAVVLLVVAVGLLVYSAAAERRDELATLVARGAGPRAVARIVMAEGLVVSLLGLLLGLMAGLVTAGAFLGLVSVLAPEGIPFVVPLGVLVPLFAVILGVWLASYLGALAIQRMDVPRVLKLRGG
jgi:ABC-type antimicrobial peptide transport system permease subunit